MDATCSANEQIDYHI